ncbi:MAG: SCO family protein [Ilumatobacteraceae bacterium]
MKDLPYFVAGSPSPSERVVQFSVPAFSFVNQDGSPLNDSFVRGKIWVAHYFFLACPSICAKMITGLQMVQSIYKADDDVKLVSLTVDPAEDSVAALKHYAVRREANPRQWQFGTGEKKALYAFAREGLGIAAADGDGGPRDFIHSDTLVLIDRNCHIRGYYDGTSPAAISHLIKDIRTLEKN